MGRRQRGLTNYELRVVTLHDQLARGGHVLALTDVKHEPATRKQPAREDYDGGAQLLDRF
jgi:hypothetical protein